MTTVPVFSVLITLMMKNLDAAAFYRQVSDRIRNEQLAGLITDMSEQYRAMGLELRKTLFPVRSEIAIPPQGISALKFYREQLISAIYEQDCQLIATLILDAESRDTKWYAMSRHHQDLSNSLSQMLEGHYKDTLRFISELQKISGKTPAMKVA